MSCCDGSGSSPRVAVFRADASVEIGGGHVRRCLAIANALAADGWTTIFACTRETPRIVPQLAAAGYRHIAVEPDAPEIDVLHAGIPDGCDMLVIDHYGARAVLDRACRGWARHITVIEDLADRVRDCDVLIDQTPGRTAAEYSKIVPRNCVVLAGSGYALLHPGFRDMRRDSRIASPTIRNVVVSFGWTDPTNATAHALEALRRADIGAKVHVMLGATSGNSSEVRALAAQLQPRAKVHVAVDDMPAFLAAADLAIGAAGISALERCCIGVPSIVAPVAANQRANANGLVMAGAALVVMPHEWNDASKLAGMIEDLYGDRRCRQRMIEAGRTLCDGHGLERVCHQIAELAQATRRRRRTADDDELVLRFATAADARKVWEWRNDAQARSMSRNATPIAWEAHATWFADCLNSADSAMLIGMIGGVPAAVIRFERKQGSAGVSINIAPSFRGRGLGKRLLSSACELMERYRFAERLNADIKPGNTSSRKIFEAAGFVLVADDGEMLHYRRQQ
jgi:UDP-2,4-diacetamido-2,4,6-trideoxy-beta-L-altropyranose hydrolase